MRPTKSKLTILSAAALFALAPVAWCAGNSNANSDQQNSSKDQSTCKTSDKTMSQADQKSQPGWVLVDENFVMLTANEPQNHFFQAEQDLSQNDTKGAASEIRLAAAYMQMQASRSQGADKQQLDKAANEVRQCVSDIHKSDSKDTSELKQTFSNADLALAQYFQMKSEAELKDNKSVMAGYDLQGAANSLQAAYAWNGKQLPDKATKQIEKAQRLAANLIAPDEEQSSSGQAQTASSTSNEGNDNASASSNTESTRKEEKMVKALGKTIKNCCSEMDQKNSA